MLLAHCSVYSREYSFLIGNCTADYYVVKKISILFLRQKPKFLSVLRMLKIPWHSKKKSGSINSQEPLAEYSWKESFSSQHRGLNLLGMLTVKETLYVIFINKINLRAFSSAGGEDWEKVQLFILLRNIPRRTYYLRICPGF